MLSLYIYKHLWSSSETALSVTDPDHPCTYDDCGSGGGGGGEWGRGGGKNGGSEGRRQASSGYTPFSKKTTTNIPLITISLQKNIIIAC